MGTDFSWKSGASTYDRLYTQVLAKARPDGNDMPAGNDMK